MGVGAASPPLGLANVYHQVPLRRTLPCLRLQGGSYYRHEERTDPVWLAGRYYDAEITVHKHALPCLKMQFFKAPTSAWCLI